MTTRMWVHPDGRGRKRSFALPETTSWDDFLAMLPAILGENAYEVVVSAGAHLEWYSPATEQELRKEAEAAAAAAERQERWERETYERLREKYKTVAALDGESNE